LLHTSWCRLERVSRERGRLYFIEEKAKINAEYYINNLLPKLVEDCHDLLSEDFIFQQDGAPAHGAKTTQEWLGQHCPNFIDKDSWPPNSPDLNPLDYHVCMGSHGGVQQAESKAAEHSRAKDGAAGDLEQSADEAIHKSVASFRNRLTVCIKA